MALFLRMTVILLEDRRDRFQRDEPRWIRSVARISVLLGRDHHGREDAHAFLVELWHEFNLDGAFVTMIERDNTEHLSRIIHAVVVRPRPCLEFE